MLYSKIIGSYGNNKIALIISAIGIVSNIILDQYSYIYLIWGYQELLWQPW